MIAQLVERWTVAVIYWYPSVVGSIPTRETSFIITFNIFIPILITLLSYYSYLTIWDDYSTKGSTTQQNRY